MTLNWKINYQSTDFGRILNIFCSEISESIDLFATLSSFSFDPIYFDPIFQNAFGQICQLYERLVGFWKHSFPNKSRIQFSRIRNSPRRTRLTLDPNKKGLWAGTRNNCYRLWFWMKRLRENSLFLNWEFLTIIKR